MKVQLGEIVISQEEIADLVQGVARQIEADYPKGTKLTFVTILRGAAIFMADLCRAVDREVELDFMDVSSYQGAFSSGKVRINHDTHNSVEGKNLILVEDIIDTGLTLSRLVPVLTARGPKSIRLCCLLDKACARTAEIKVDYIGREVDNDFLVGYGLDYNDRFRNLPDIHRCHILEA